MIDTLHQSAAGMVMLLADIPLTINTIVAVSSALASLVVVAAAALALEKMNKNTSRLIFTAYLLLFAGGGASTAAAILSVFDKPMNEWQHLSMLVMLSGLSLLFLCTRRRSRMCPHCSCRQGRNCGCESSAIRPCDFQDH